MVPEMTAGHLWACPAIFKGGIWWPSRHPRHPGITNRNHTLNRNSKPKSSTLGRVRKFSLNFETVSFRHWIGVVGRVFCRLMVDDPWPGSTGWSYNLIYCRVRCAELWSRRKPNSSRDQLQLESSLVCVGVAIADDDHCRLESEKWQINDLKTTFHCWESWR